MGSGAGVRCARRVEVLAGLVAALRLIAPRAVAIALVGLLESLLTDEAGRRHPLLHRKAEQDRLAQSYADFCGGTLAHLRAVLVS